MKKTGLYILLAGCFLLFTACSVQKDDTKKLRDIDFTVVDPADVPEELAERIKEKEEKPCGMTYADRGYLYVARGYGKKPTSGYSVEVKECYETANTLAVRTGLLGPSGEEETIEKDTCPYVVIKMEYSEKDVVFK